MFYTFQLEESNVGPLSKIIIGHDSFGPGAGWFLDDVSLFKTDFGKPHVAYTHIVEIIVSPK